MKLKKCKKCGGTKRRDGRCLLCEMFAAAGSAPGGDQPEGWPRESLALCVHPDQAKEYTEHASEMGVPTYFNPKNGRPVFTNQRHQKAYEKVYGFFNRDAFS